MKQTIFFLLLFVSTFLGAQDLVINEIMSSNDAYLLDEDGDESDWIEIYNASNSSISLAGHHLSDESDNLSKWAFPDMMLGSNEFLIVFASDKDRANPGSELHSNFKIKGEGEALFLSDNGINIHSVPSIELNENTSYGLQTDGSNPFVIFLEPSPGVSNNFSISSNVVSFSKAGGIYDNRFSLSLSTEMPNTQIYYTTDGTSPTVNSIQYTGPLALNESLHSQANISQMQIAPDDYHNIPSINSMIKGIVIRAAAFDMLGNQISQTGTNSYFIKELGVDHNDLPIVSISAEHDDLFDFETGIFARGVHWNEDNPNWTGNYYQRGDEWERIINIEFYESDGNTGFRQQAGLRTHGGNSRRYSQKGMKVYARSEYGNSRFEYPIFEDSPLQSYKRLVLKPFAASWTKSGAENYITGKIAQTLNVEAGDLRPVILYLNGEYWGVYFLQERIDKWFFADHFSLDTDSIDLIAGWWGGIIEGSNQDFHTIYSFVRDNDVTDPSNYEMLSNWMDIDNFIDYQIFQIFIANYDWPINNTKSWKPQKEDTKLRWIFFDGDAGLKSFDEDSYAHALDNSNDSWPTNGHSTLFLRKLLTNPVFYEKYMSRLDYLLNNQLNYANTKTIYQDIITAFEPEILNNINRFEFPDSYIQWEEKIANCSNFLYNRSCFLKELTKERFDEDLFLDECTNGFDLSSIANLSVFPNPNNGHFTLKMNASSTFSSELQITNLLGQSLATIDLRIYKGENAIDINLPDSSEGVLFVNLIGENETKSIKVVCFK